MVNRTAKRLTLIVLILVEVLLFTGFLPYWQQRMYDTVWPFKTYDYSRITHPDIEGELEPYSSIVLCSLAALNGALIFLVWRRKAK
jgi:hypothetical protein